jgi:hypothetical protein
MAANNDGEQDDLNETELKRAKADCRSTSLVLEELFSKDPLYEEKFQNYCRSKDLNQNETQDDKTSVPEMRIAKRK